MKAILSLILALVFSTQLQANQVKNTLPCGPQQDINDTIAEYNEVGFAKAVGLLQVSGGYIKTNLTIYLNASGTFTITADMDDGTVCLLTSGTDFIPIKSTQPLPDTPDSKKPEYMDTSL